MSGRAWARTVARAVVPAAARRGVRQYQRWSLSTLSRLIMAPKKHDFRNSEGLRNFDFTLPEWHRREGVTALIRIRNEEDKIRYALSSILEVFDEIVLVDNGSEDATLDVVRRLKAEKDREDKIKIFYYPFMVARAGPEHLSTPEDSVHSLVYYYNWALSKCTCRYAFKWDGDMILKKDARSALASFFRQIGREEDKWWILSGQIVWRGLDGSFYLSKQELSREPRLFPCGLNPRFHKAENWEVLKAEPKLDLAEYEGVVFYEVQFADADEFSHWSTRDFRDPVLRRKEKMWENYHLIRHGEVASDRFETLPRGFLDDETR